MLDGLLSWLAPHPCISCGALGTLLCSYCKKYIIGHKTRHCLWCNRPSRHGLCDLHVGDYYRAYWLGDRYGALQTLVDDPKLRGRREASRVAAQLLAAAFHIPPSAWLVPLPTSTKHVRMRGYDHTAALVYHVSRATGALARPILQRARHFVQKDVSRAERFAQVQGAFVVNEALNPATLYILVDDVVTSGASAAEAARSLRAAGARQIWLLCIARQPLD